MSYMKDLLMTEYERLADLFPDLHSDDLADLAYVAAVERLADIADQLAERAKYND